MNQPVSHSDPVSIDAAALAADPFALAQQLILEPAGLDENAIVQALAAATGPGIDAADLYFQFARDESWSLEDGIVKEGSANIEQGVGVRALSGEKTGFA
jgi:TldD protein